MNQSGQTMILAVLLGALLLITGAVIVYVNQVGTLHQTASVQRSAAQNITHEGIADAINALSGSATIWKNAVSGSQFPADCNVGDITSSSGGRFQLQCSVDFQTLNLLQPYEVSVIAIAMSPPAANGTETPLRSLQAYLSPRTLGVDLAGNVHTGAAVQMVSQPLVSGILNVHWGPIVCLDSNPTPWTLLTPLDDQQYPRKFSQGGITGTTFSRSGSTLGSGPNSDQKEYWAYAAQINPPFIDEVSYQTRASNTNNVPPPVSKNSGINRYPINSVNCAGSNCNYFQPDAADTALFDAGYTAPAGAVIYVDGNAQFDDVSLDSVTFIVTGNLTISTAAVSGGAAMSLHVPVTAALEYPYAPVTPTSWPCSNQAGVSGAPAYGCDSSNVFNATGNNGNVQFWGFLYVKGNLTVNASNWNMVGSLLVGDMQKPGGQIQIGSGAALNVAYDDITNHNILVLPVNGSAIRIEPDLLQEIPTR